MLVSGRGWQRPGIRGRTCPEQATSGSAPGRRARVENTAPVKLVLYLRVPQWFRRHDRARAPVRMREELDEPKAAIKDRNPVTKSLLETMLPGDGFMIE